MKKRWKIIFGVVRAALYFGGGVAAITAAKASSVKIEYWLWLALAIFLLAAAVAASVIIFRPDRQ